MTKKLQQIKKLAYVTTCGPSGRSKGVGETIEITEMVRPGSRRGPEVACRPGCERGIQRIPPLRQDTGMHLAHEACSTRIIFFDSAVPAHIAFVR